MNYKTCHKHSTSSLSVSIKATYTHFRITHFVSIDHQQTIQTLYLQTICMGIIFGFALNKGRVFEPAVIIDQFLFKRWIMMKVTYLPSLPKKQISDHVSIPICNAMKWNKTQRQFTTDVSISSSYINLMLILNENSNTNSIHNCPK